MAEHTSSVSVGYQEARSNRSEKSKVMIARGFNLYRAFQNTRSDGAQSERLHQAIEVLRDDKNIVFELVDGSGPDGIGTEIWVKPNNGEFSANETRAQVEEALE